jgi:hypothetical protein
MKRAVMVKAGILRRAAFLPQDPDPRGYSTRKPQRPEYRLRASTGRVRFNMCRRFTSAQASNLMVLRDHVSPNHIKLRAFPRYNDQTARLSGGRSIDRLEQPNVAEALDSLNNPRGEA